MLLEAKGVAQLHPNEWGKIGVEWECGGLGGGKLLIVRGFRGPGIRDAAASRLVYLLPSASLPSVPAAGSVDSTL
jgi:hypothetical protein